MRSVAKVESILILHENDKVQSVEREEDVQVILDFIKEKKIKFAKKK